ncbi:hypothetical protein ACFLU6_04625 [Acidobacteriota bacterium]
MARIYSDYPVNLRVAKKGKYVRWLDSEDPPGILGSTGVYETEFEFDAPKDGTYVLWIENDDEDDGEDAAVTIDIAIWTFDEDEE